MNKKLSRADKLSEKEEADANEIALDVFNGSLGALRGVDMVPAGEESPVVRRLYQDFSYTTNYGDPVEESLRRFDGSPDQDINKLAEILKKGQKREGEQGD